MTITVRRHTMVLLLTTLALSSCGSDEHEDTKAWMANVSKDMRGRVQPIPEIRPFPIVSYDAGDLLDPFSPLKVAPDRKKSGSGVQPDLTRQKELLEAYPLDALKMVGVVRDGKTMYALIQLDKSVHKVKSGNHMGQNFGVITGITESEIAIKELVQDPSEQSSDWVERVTTLQLQGQAEQQKGVN